VSFKKSNKTFQFNGMEWNGMEWNLEWNGMEWNGMEYYFYWMIINEITPLGGVKRYSEEFDFQKFFSDPEK
jgi:hypothetical protein